MENKEVRKLSAFEFAIMEVADPEQAKDLQPYTPEEELEMRIQKLKDQASGLAIPIHNTK
jgi:hypothetical protein